LNLRPQIVKATVSRIGFGLKHPEVAMRYVLLGKEGFTCHQIPRLTGAERSKVEGIYAEILRKNELEAHIRKVLGGRYCGQISFTAARSLYTICRLLQPRVVIETGVAAGISSAFVLKALEDNSSGLLHSIDLPNYEEMLVGTDPKYAEGGPKAVLPVGQQSGFVIPGQLRSKWNLHLGLSSEILPNVLSEVGQIDMFIHDSEHSYRNMLFEYRTAWPSIREGGVLLSDDVSWNRAFHDFSSHVKRRPQYLYGRGFAGIRK
jgi:predicted O-methyltransferase YrrM